MKQANDTGPDKDQCEDLNISLPCGLANRIRHFAEDNHTSLTNVLIEALDAFLRKQNDR
jgi:hypothetical protein